jgi:hypothetical protein
MTIRQKEGLLAGHEGRYKGAVSLAKQIRDRASWRKVRPRFLLVGALMWLVAYFVPAFRPVRFALVGALEVWILGAVAVTLWRLRRLPAGNRWSRVQQALEPTLGSALSSLFVTEVRAVGACFRPPAAAQGFSHARTGNAKQVVVMIIVVSLFEAPAVHLLLRDHGMVRVALAFLNVYAIVWIIGEYRALVPGAHRLTSEGIDIDVGVRWSAFVPYGAVADIRAAEGPRRARGDVAVLTVFDLPNVLVTLSAPIEVARMTGLRRPVRQIWLRADDPAAFVAAVAARRSIPISEGTRP